MKSYFSNKPLSFCLFVIGTLILIFLFNLIRESLDRENRAIRKKFRKNYRAYGYFKAKYWKLPVFYNPETGEMAGRNALIELLTDIFIWIDVHILYCEGFNVFVLEEPEELEEEGDCTNTNPYVYQSTGERQGCIQSCDECDYNSKNIKK